MIKKPGKPESYLLAEACGFGRKYLRVVRRAEWVETLQHPAGQGLPCEVFQGVDEGDAGRGL